MLFNRKTISFCHFSSNIAPVHQTRRFSSENFFYQRVFDFGRTFISSLCFQSKSKSTFPIFGSWLYFVSDCCISLSRNGQLLVSTPSNHSRCRSILGKQNSFVVECNRY